VGGCSGGPVGRADPKFLFQMREGGHPTENGSADECMFGSPTSFMQARCN
jgi:hypothetical protein